MRNKLKDALHPRAATPATPLQHCPRDVFPVSVKCEKDASSISAMIRDHPPTRLLTIR